MKIWLKSTSVFLSGIFFLLSFFAYQAHANPFKVAIMQDKKGAANKFKPLQPYLRKKGIEVTFMKTYSYREAAQKFAAGEVDGMFSGSGVAGSMIIKDVAYPLVRPVSRDGWSTYWAVLVAKKGSPTFTHKAEYFSGKTVSFSALASSGEFFFRSIDRGHTVEAKLRIAPSHGNALYMVSKGYADVAVVKNRVWDSLKSNYPGLIVVGEDKGENPNGTLIISKTADNRVAEKIKSVLTALKDDTSPEARAVRDEMKIQGYVETTLNDFTHTLSLLKKAGVTKDFNFSF